MVTPETGIMTFQGQSGRRYSLSFYSSDVLAAPVTFNLNGTAVAGSPNFYIAPENITLIDVSVITGQTVTTSWVAQINDVNTGNIISVANSINTLANRVSPGIGYAAGRKITFVQA
jgi:hypothetical protein